MQPGMDEALRSLGLFLSVRIKAGLLLDGAEAKTMGSNQEGKRCAAWRSLIPLLQQCGSLG